MDGLTQDERSKPSRRNEIMTHLVVIIFMLCLTAIGITVDYFYTERTKVEASVKMYQCAIQKPKKKFR